MEKQKKGFVAVMIVIVASLTCVGDMINVPDDYLTIQEAVNNSFDGDEIVVADGTFTGVGNKNIDMGGRAITIRSDNGPEKTIIDCQKQDRAFSFVSGEGGDSVISGFTIINGDTWTDSPISKKGGAVLILSSSPTIQNCIFQSNKSHSGGAILVYIHPDGPPSDPSIINCVFLGNISDQRNGDGDGGAIVISYSQGYIKNCLFIDNRGQRVGGGGAIRNYRSSPDIINCTFANNFAGYGGAIDNSPECSPEIVNTIFWNNSSPRGNEMHNAVNSHPVFTNCDIKGGWNGPNIRNDSGSYVIDGEGNINADPLFTIGPKGNYYLSQISSGQGADSDCIDAGNEMAINLELDVLSTRTDEIADVGMVDIGFHYPAVETDPIQTAIRTILLTIEKKELILEDIDYLLQQETSVLNIIDDALENEEHEGLKKRDLIKARQKIHSAMQHQWQALDMLQKSLNKLSQALSSIDNQEQ